MEQKELLKKLFSWSNVLNLVNEKDEVVMKVYQRLVGDMDLQKARMSALRFSRELRLRLRDVASDEYIGLVQPIEDLTRDQLITLLLVDSIDSARQEIDRDYYYAEPKEPDEFATTEEHEVYAHKWETWEAEREKDYQHKLVAKMDFLKEQFELLSDETLLARAKTMRIEALCEQELKNRFLEMCVLFGTYEDAQFTKHLFDTYLEFASQPDAVKNQLIEGYARLEMSTIGLKESTKSQASEQVSTSQ
jgi:hypothetical protein